MSSAAPSPPPLRPSVFISYASEDRAAARALRDTLLQAGLEVWYDENELGGGDAWDQKIRRQIRDCDYFLPIVSATTERRKEGYFRREWRIATERTLDMADDVLFLLPVAIDDTSELGARVPEKFLSVQWLRLPGGQRTPALDTLVQRLLAGEHTMPTTTRPPLLTRPPMHTQPPMQTQPPFQGQATMPPMAVPPAQEQHRHAPPMPPFPHAPENGGVGLWSKFVAETIWWGVTATWLVVMRLPRWLRIVLTIWFVFMLLSTCGGGGSGPRSREKSPPSPNSKQNEEAIAAAVENFIGAAAHGAKEKDWDKFGEELARRFGKHSPKGPSTEKRVALVPFQPPGRESPSTQFAQRVFAATYGKLVVARPGEVFIAATRPVASDEEFAHAGKRLRADLVLGFRISKGADDTESLAARLIRSESGETVWSADYAVAGGDTADVGEKVAEAAMNALPPKKP